MAKFKQILIDGILTDIQLSDSGIFSCEYQKRYYQSTSLNALITKVKKSKLTTEKLKKVEYLIKLNVTVTFDKIKWDIKDISYVLTDKPAYFIKQVTKFSTQFYVSTEKEERYYLDAAPVINFDKYLQTLRSIFQFSVSASEKNNKIYFLNKETTLILTSSMFSLETLIKYIDNSFNKEQELLNILNK